MLWIAQSVAEPLVAFPNSDSDIPGMELSRVQHYLSEVPMHNEPQVTLQAESPSPEQEEEEGEERRSGRQDWVQGYEETEH